MAEETPEEFVTVSAAAAMLGVSDRTARRMAGQLADDDRTPDSGQGRRVRLSAMRSLREKPGQAADSVAGQNPAMTDRTKSAGRGRPVNVSDPLTGQLAQKLADAESRAAVAEAKAEERDRHIESKSQEIERLNTALEKSQSLQLAALGEAAAMRARMETLEKQNRALIEGNPMHGGETGKSHAVPPGETVQERPETSTDRRETARNGGFWARVRGIFGGGSAE